MKLINKIKFLIEDKNYQLLKLVDLLESIYDLFESIDSIKKVFVDSGIFTEEQFNQILDLIPDTKKDKNGNIKGVSKFGRWFLNFCRENNIKDPKKEIENIEDYLKQIKELSEKRSNFNFNEIKTLNDLKFINVLKSVNINLKDLQVVSDSHYVKDLKARIRALKKNKKFFEYDAYVVDETDEWLVRQPSTEEAACIVGEGTNWCFSANSKDNYFDSGYSPDHGNLYVFLSKEKPYLKFAAFYNKEVVKENIGNLPVEDVSEFKDAQNVDPDFSFSEFIYAIGVDCFDFYYNGVKEYSFSYEEYKNGDFDFWKEILERYKNGNERFFELGLLTTTPPKDFLKYLAKTGEYQLLDLIGVYRNLTEDEIKIILDNLRSESILVYTELSKQKEFPEKYEDKLKEISSEVYFYHLISKNKYDKAKQLIPTLSDKEILSILNNLKTNKKDLIISLLNKMEKYSVPLNIDLYPEAFEIARNKENLSHNFKASFPIEFLYYSQTTDVDEKLVKELLSKVLIDFYNSRGFLDNLNAYPDLLKYFTEDQILKLIKSNSRHIFLIITLLEKLNIKLSDKFYREVFEFLKENPDVVKSYLREDIDHLAYYTDSFFSKFPDDIKEDFYDTFHNNFSYLNKDSFNFTISADKELAEKIYRDSDRISTKVALFFNENFNKDTLDEFNKRELLDILRNVFYFNDLKNLSIEKLKEIGKKFEGEDLNQYYALLAETFPLEKLKPFLINRNIDLDTLTQNPYVLDFQHELIDILDEENLIKHFNKVHLTEKRLTINDFKKLLKKTYFNLKILYRILVSDDISFQTKKDLAYFLNKKIVMRNIKDHTLDPDKTRILLKNLFYLNPVKFKEGGIVYFKDYIPDTYTDFLIQNSELVKYLSEIGHLHFILALIESNDDKKVNLGLKEFFDKYLNYSEIYLKEGEIYFVLDPRLLENYKDDIISELKSSFDFKKEIRDDLMQSRLINSFLDKLGLTIDDFGKGKLPPDLEKSIYDEYVEEKAESMYECLEDSNFTIQFPKDEFLEVFWDTYSNIYISEYDYEDKDEYNEKLVQEVRSLDFSDGLINSLIGRSLDILVKDAKTFCYDNFNDESFDIRIEPIINDALRKYNEVEDNK